MAGNLWMKRINAPSSIASRRESWTLIVESMLAPPPPFE
jgi:hypothetical protein